MGPATEIRLLISIRHSQAHICNTVCSFGPPKTQEISRNEITLRDGPSKTVTELLYLTHRSSFRPRFTHPEKRKLWELTIVIYNLTGTGKERSDFRGAQRKDKKSQDGEGTLWLDTRCPSSPPGGWLCTGSKETVERPCSQICRAQLRLSKLAVVPARC